MSELEKAVQAARIAVAESERKFDPFATIGRGYLLRLIEVAQEDITMRKMLRESV